MLNDVLSRLNSTVFVPPVPPQKTATPAQTINKLLSAADHKKLSAYLAAIDETDQNTIDALFTECAQDAKVLAKILSRADKVPVNQPVPQVVTCRNCTHFSSLNKHGGGAGHCSAGVHTAGYYRWADTMHQCENYKLNRIKA